MDRLINLVDQRILIELQTMDTYTLQLFNVFYKIGTFKISVKIVET